MNSDQPIPDQPLSDRQTVDHQSQASLPLEPNPSTDQYHTQFQTMQLPVSTESSSKTYENQEAVDLARAKIATLGASAAHLQVAPPLQTQSTITNQTSSIPDPLPAQLTQHQQFETFVPPAEHHEQIAKYLVPANQPTTRANPMGIEVKKPKLPSKLKPLLAAIAVGIVVYIIFNSQIILGQLKYLTTPKDEGTPTTNTVAVETVSPEPIIIIPKINVNVPVVYDEISFDEKKVQKALERGVVHYGTTAVPGQVGNNVIVGHSSNNWWASGQYKFAFILLDKLEPGDTFVLHYNSVRYVYQVFNKQVVEPNDTSTIQPTNEPTTTLITCTPPGTSWRRLVIQARQTSPDPKDSAKIAKQKIDQSDVTLPSNTPSIIDKIREWIGS